MPNYCVNMNAQTSGQHEVHNTASTKGCLPNPKNMHVLGWYSDCSSAVKAAKDLGYKPADGCYYCCKSADHG